MFLIWGERIAEIGEDLARGLGPLVRRVEGGDEDILVLVAPATARKTGVVDEGRMSEIEVESETEAGSEIGIGIGIEIG